MKNFIQTYKFVPLKILIPIYDALFSTCIVYSLVVCSYTFTDNIEKLIKLQKKKMFTPSDLLKLSCTLNSNF